MRRAPRPMRRSSSSSPPPCFRASARDTEHLTWPRPRRRRRARRDGQRRGAAARRRGALPHAGRADPGGHLHGGARRGQERGLRQPAHRADARLHASEEWLEDPFLWYWRLHPDDRAAVERGVRARRAHRRAVPRRVSLPRARRPRRLGPRRGAHHQGRARPAAVPAGRRVRHHREQARAGDRCSHDAVDAAPSVDEELAIARRVQTSIAARASSPSTGLEIAAAMMPGRRGRRRLLRRPAGRRRRVARDRRRLRSRPGRRPGDADGAERRSRR